MKTTIKYTPVGNNPNDLTLSPPLVPEVTVFSGKGGHTAVLPTKCANKLVAENPKIFSVVPTVVPDEMEMQDLEAIDDLDELVMLGEDRFGVSLNPSMGASALRVKLLELQEEAAAADDEPVKKNQKPRKPKAKADEAGNDDLI